jgi:adenylyl-sulfate kinase
MTTPLTIWFSGLSGAGKSTLSSATAHALTDRGLRVRLLDSEQLRSSQLGFDRAARATQVRKLAEFAKAAMKEVDVVLVAAMSLFGDARQAAARIIGPKQFALIHVDAPLALCELRDQKPIYARARSGELRHVVGFDMPYEIPRMPALRVDTHAHDVASCCEQVLGVLELDSQK